MKKFAYLLTGKVYDTQTHRAVFETKNLISYIYTVHDFEDALSRIPQLLEDGVGAVELCGGFGRENAIKFAKATEGKIAVSYVTNEPDQVPLINKFFGH